jgi:hypothetical protein
LVEVIQHRCAELVEAAIGKLHLRLDADGSCHAPAGGTVGHVGQQRALSDAGLSAQHDNAAPSAERVGQEAVERLTLGLTSDQQHRLDPTLNSRPLRDAGATTSESPWCDAAGEVRGSALTN